ncbi:hypothetical protein HMPREF1624_04311 [Sporothrix schenckii ATCC 58251]|uniref:Uncharacterized protein n=1 Tax=Sporothrix schenckii (strain ATCC 58251 / de Perez 2211183) TaxID=1391915 RepID=U7PXC6_SPOS1|nr:hypothetical protein HMPREF1624_04311 [Sporothrix schenckii ATCC 58251]
MASLLKAVVVAAVSIPVVFCEPLPSPAPTPVPLSAPVPVAGVIAGIDGPPTTTAYSDEVCKPPTVHPFDPLPPCVDIENIETLCYPNGTAPLYLAAHAQCMCRGSYFPEWNACRRCLSVHGQLSDHDLAFFQSVASAASTSLCGFLTAGGGRPTTTPTAIFRDLFTSAQAHLTSPTGAVATAASSVGPDVSPNNTDVGLYFTQSGPEGPGSITGSATAATATGLALATGHPQPPGGASGSSLGASDTSAPSSGSSPSTSASGSAASQSGSIPSLAVRVDRSGALLVVILSAFCAL